MHVFHVVHISGIIRTADIHHVASDIFSTLYLLQQWYYCVLHYCPSQIAYFISTMPRAPSMLLLLAVVYYLFTLFISQQRHP